MKIGYEFAMHLLGAIYSTNHIFCYSRDSIPSLATMVHFSALAFLAPTNPRNPRNPPKLKLFKLIMEDPNQRRSNRSRKPTVPYDERIAQSLDLSTHCSVSKPSKKPTAKPTESAKSIPLTLAPVLIDAIDELCDGIEELDLKAKKKAKADEIGRLSKLGLKKVMEEAKNPKDVHFDPFDPGDTREPKLNIPSNIDVSDPLELLDLFIPSKIYTTIAENTNLYAAAHNVSTTRSSINTRYWWPTNENEIRVLFSILLYMGVHKEPNYKIYWETT